MLRGRGTGAPAGLPGRIAAAFALVCLLAAPTSAGARSRHSGGSAESLRAGPSAHAGDHRRRRGGAQVAGDRLRRVSEYGALTLHGKGSSTTIQEQGRGWGSFHARVAITMTLHGTLVRAHYTAYPKGGGSISGTARARIHKANGKYASFSGTIYLHGGSGAYARASGRAGFYGTINRHTYAMRVHIAGRVRL